MGGFLFESFIGGLAVEAAVESFEVVVVLPYAAPVVEHVGVVDGDAFEQSVELFGVDAV